MISYKFYNACVHGNLNLAQQLLQDNPDIDVFGFNNIAFRLACENGHIEVAQWLYNIEPDHISCYELECIFERACKNDHLNLVQWLLHIKPTLDISSYSVLVYESTICRSVQISKRIQSWLQTHNPFRYFMNYVEKKEAILFILYAFNYNKYTNYVSANIVSNIQQYTVIKSDEYNE